MNKLVFLLLIAFLSFGNINSQRGEVYNDVEKVEISIKKLYPKFWGELEKVKKNDVKVIYKTGMRSPGAARGTQKIFLDVKFLLQENEKYPENRLLIILWHEYGHTRFNRKVPRSQRNVELNEHAAFKYSINDAMDYFNHKKDKGPLKEVIKNLKIRSEKGNLKNPHTIAIKKVMQENIWKKAESLISE